MDKKIELQQNLKNQISVKPSSFYKKINTPSISGSSQTIGPNPVINNFYIPSGVLNFSLMELRFNFTIPEVNARYIFFHCDYFPWITRMELYSTANKIPLVDIQDVDKINKLCNPMYLDYKKNSVGSGFFHKSTRSTTTGVLRVDDPPIQALATVSPNSITTDSTGTANIGVEKNLPGIWTTGAIGNGGGAGNVSAAVTIKLKDLIHDSIFSINRDIPSENLILKITWNTRGNIYYTGDANKANNAVAAADIAITELGLNVFSQNNPDIVKTITQRNEVGEEYVIPHIELYTQPFAANLTGHSTGIRPESAFSNSHLYKTYSSIFITDIFEDGAATNQRQNNCSNHNAGLWTNCIYYLNNDIIKEVSATNNEDFNDMADRFKLDGTSLYDRTLVRHSGAILTVFDSDKIDIHDEYNKNELKGIPFNYMGRDVSIQHKWTLPAINQTKTDYYYCVVLKSLYSKNGKFSMLPL